MEIQTRQATFMYVTWNSTNPYMRLCSHTMKHLLNFNGLLLKIVHF